MSDLRDLRDLRAVGFLQGAVIAGISVPLPPPSVARGGLAVLGETLGPASQCTIYISSC